MKVLGIDPGSRRMGFGIIEKSAHGIILIHADTCDIVSSTHTGALQSIKVYCDALIKKYQPSILSLEKVFFARNQKTALAVSEARGVVLLAAGEYKIPVYEYTPTEVKYAVTGYGRADKKAIAKMVRLLLKNPDVKGLDDTTDALAIALCALKEAPYSTH